MKTSLWGWLNQYISKKLILLIHNKKLPELHLVRVMQQYQLNQIRHNGIHFLRYHTLITTISSRSLEFGQHVRQHPTKSCECLATISSLDQKTPDTNFGHANQK